MNFKPKLWHPIAFVLSAANWAGAGFAVAAAEPWHAAGHVALAMGFTWWAQRLRQSPGSGDREARFDELEAEVSQLGRELGEVQERLDFTERMLAQVQETRRLGQER